MTRDPNTPSIYHGNVLLAAMARLRANPESGGAWNPQLTEYLRQTMLEMDAQLTRRTRHESDRDFPGTWTAALTLARAILIHTPDRDDFPLIDPLDLTTNRLDDDQD
ncbi:MAG TPA: hypothetical protein VGS97_10465 [Actinocrinis sp.]|uniref:hypothetical protein n=1 Tax=Actinocrinis sp. TaxID=1920516 RepID=UPI002DDCC389|nr:hypothetical protein [Actinocrinis sp.]HEV2344504.1 hypothetical protein [Actinocrinis sp.]